MRRKLLVGCILRKRNTSGKNDDNDKKEDTDQPAAVRECRTDSHERVREVYRLRESVGGVVNCLQQ